MDIALSIAHKHAAISVTAVTAADKTVDIVDALLATLVPVELAEDEHLAAGLHRNLEGLLITIG